jgi:hypothetical protein
MPERLDQIPPLAMRPQPPRLRLWLALLVLFLLTSMGLTLSLDDLALQQGTNDWLTTLGIPLAAWSALGFVRALIFLIEHRNADGWDEARELEWMGRVRQGRRSQQVLAASLYTALRAPEDRTGAGQLDALLGDVSAFKAQPSREEAPGIRHSRLPVEGEQPEELLLQALTKVFADLAPTLLRVSEKTPLALLREIDSSLSADAMQQVWQQAWEASGIRQSLIPVEGSGLTVLDKWLDHHITDPALLLVVALQIAPSQPQGTAEAAVGVLLGNRLTQTTLSPMAYLHRPEQEQAPTTEALRYAVRQALDWVPLTAQAIERVWRAGIDKQRDADIATVLSEVAMPTRHTQGLCDLDALLGQPGKAAPWLAIAAATRTVERGAGSQFIFSGDGPVETGLWSTVLMPVPAPST